MYYVNVILGQKMDTLYVRTCKSINACMLESICIHSVIYICNTCMYQ